jgi:hypothetical protein
MPAKNFKEGNQRYHICSARGNNSSDFLLNFLFLLRNKKIGCRKRDYASRVMIRD